MKPARDLSATQRGRSWIVATILVGLTGSSAAVVAAPEGPTAPGKAGGAPTPDNPAIVTPIKSQGDHTTGHADDVRYVGRVSEPAASDGFCAIVEFQSEHYLLLAGSEFRGFLVESFDEHLLNLRHISSGKLVALPIASGPQARQSGNATPEVENTPFSSRDDRRERPQKDMPAPAAIPDAPTQDRDTSRQRQPVLTTTTTPAPTRLGGATRAPVGHQANADHVATTSAIPAPPPGSETMSLLPPIADDFDSNEIPDPQSATPMELLPPIDISDSSGDTVPDDTPPPGGILPQ